MILPGSNAGPATSIAGKAIDPTTVPTSGKVLALSVANQWAATDPATLAIAGGAVVSQGTLAARPAAGTQGRFYWATDTATLYYDDGSTWQTFSTGSSAAAATEKAISGGQITYVSATTATVEAVKARDSGNTTDLAQASRRTLDVSTVDADLGIERKVLSGAGCIFNGTTAVVGNGGNLFLTEFAPGSAPRSLTGTIGTGGAASSTITGTSTRFVEELAPGDLIGNSAVGYAEVTAIASNTSLTVGSNLTIANGSTGKVIEWPTIEAGNGGDVSKVKAIADDTHLTIDSTSANATLNGYVGRKHATTTCVLHVWLAASGKLFLSLQYTTPHGTIAGVGTAFRRLGSLVISSGNVVPMLTVGEGRVRDFLLDNAEAGNGTRILGSGASTGWSPVDSPITPQPAVALWLNLYNNANGGTGQVDLYARKRASGSATATRNAYSVVQSNLANVGGNAMILIPCGRGGAIDYAISNAAGSGAYLEQYGWRETL